jgi:arsenate reductase
MSTGNGRARRNSGYKPGQQLAERINDPGHEPVVGPLAPLLTLEHTGLGIDVTTEQPKVLTPDALKASDVVITMGCGDACPILPGKSYEDWVLEDPAGLEVDAVRLIRDQIRERVHRLVRELVPA